jgi:hypothetical protein
LTSSRIPSFSNRMSRWRSIDDDDNDQMAVLP